MKDGHAPIQTETSRSTNFKAYIYIAAWIFEYKFRSLFQGDVILRFGKYYPFMMASSFFLQVFLKQLNGKRQHRN